jgi:hypothetical protein
MLQFQNQGQGRGEGGGPRSFHDLDEKQRRGGVSRALKHTHMRRLRRWTIACRRRKTEQFRRKVFLSWMAAAAASRQARVQFGENLQALWCTKVLVSCFDVLRDRRVYKKKKKAAILVHRAHERKRCYLWWLRLKRSRGVTRENLRRIIREKIMFGTLDRDRMLRQGFARWHVATHEGAHVFHLRRKRCIWELWCKSVTAGAHYRLVLKRKVFRPWFHHTSGLRKGRVAMSTVHRLLHVMKAYAKRRSGAYVYRYFARLAAHVGVQLHTADVAAGAVEKHRHTPLHVKRGTVHPFPFTRPRLSSYVHTLTRGTGTGRGCGQDQDRDRDRDKGMDAESRLLARRVHSGGLRGGGAISAANAFVERSFHGRDHGKDILERNGLVGTRTGARVGVGEGEGGIGEDEDESGAMARLRSSFSSKIRELKLQ